MGEKVCKSLSHWLSSLLFLGFIEPHLAGGTRGLKNHTTFNSFKWTKEDSVVRFRAKPLPQDSEAMFRPRYGLQLVNSDISYEPVGAAEFRIEKLDLERVLLSMRKYFDTLEAPEKMDVVNSWDKFKEEIERLPMKRQLNLFPTMKLSDLPKQVSEPSPSSSSQFEISAEHQLHGEHVDLDARDGDTEDLEVGTEICVYTDVKKWRPWLGKGLKM